MPAKRKTRYCPKCKEVIDRDQWTAVRRHGDCGCDLDNRRARRRRERYTYLIPTNARHISILQRYCAGKTLGAIGEDEGCSGARIHMIVTRYRRGADA